MNRSVRSILSKIPVSFNKTIRTDKFTQQVVKKVLSQDTSSLVDVGSHKGDVLKLALKYAPKGEHYGYDPIPSFYAKLEKEYKNYLNLQQIAITDKTGEETFYFVESNPSFSGLKKRIYPKNEKITELYVKTDTLDNLLVEAPRIDLIKIDVEGAEYKTIYGAQTIIFKHHPVLLFEHSAGAAEFYDTNSDKMWGLLVEQLGMKINTTKGFLANSKPFTRSHFKLLFETGQELFFVAHF